MKTKSLKYLFIILLIGLNLSLNSMEGKKFYSSENDIGDKTELSEIPIHEKLEKENNNIYNQFQKLKKKEGKKSSKECMQSIKTSLKEIETIFDDTLKSKIDKGMKSLIIGAIDTFLDFLMGQELKVFNEENKKQNSVLVEENPKAFFYYKNGNLSSKDWAEQNEIGFNQDNKKIYDTTRKLIKDLNGSSKFAIQHTIKKEILE